jgi:hypothetical protein
MNASSRSGSDRRGKATLMYNEAGESDGKATEIEEERVERTEGNKTKCINSTAIGRTQTAKVKKGRTNRRIQTELHADECILKRGERHEGITR